MIVDFIVQTSSHFNRHYNEQRGNYDINDYALSIPTGISDWINAYVDQQTNRERAIYKQTLLDNDNL